jgi:hypothetical protein
VRILLPLDEHHAHGRAVKGQDNAFSLRVNAAINNSVRFAAIFFSSLSFLSPSSTSAYPHSNRLMLLLLALRLLRASVQP